MKKLLITGIIVLLGSFQSISAKVPIGNTEKIKVVHEFPNTEDYMTNPGRFVDLGILYEAFTIGGAPFWINEDPVFVGVENENTNFFLELDPKEADEIIAEHKLDKEKLLHLGFMDKHGGFIYFGAVILLIFLYNKFFGAKSEDEIEDLPEVKK